MLILFRLVKHSKELLLIAFITLLPTAILWIPFILRLPSVWGIPLPQSGMATIVANYDGPLYLVVAKTLYNANLIKSTYPFNLPVEYYAAHFPLFPALIRLIAPVFGYAYSMLIITNLSAVLATFYFYKFIKEFVGKHALFAAFVFSIFPARFLISHSVGSADPLFVACIIASIYHFRKSQYFTAGIWGALAAFTKSPAILLFVAYFGYLTTHKMKSLVTGSLVTWVKSLDIKKTLPIFLIPLGLIGVFLIYKQIYGNFFAYFNSGDNIHLFFPPFQIFNYHQPWVGTFWLEEIIFVYLFGVLGLIRLIKQKETVLAWFVGLFFISILFVSHRDLIRYSLPIVPFLYVAFSKFLTQSEFKYVILVIIVPIFLFSLVFISQNVMPISEWAPFL